VVIHLINETAVGYATISTGALPSYYGIISNSWYVGDNHVPLLWYGWKIKSATMNRRVDLIDIVPTLAYFLNISPPNAATGEIVLELVE